MNIGEFFITLGFNADTIKVKDFVNAMKDLPIQAVAGIAALAGVEFEITKIADEAMRAAVGFQLFTSETGLSWQELQRWQIVAQQANVSAESVAQSVTALQRQMAEIRLGRGNIAPFQILGINPNQSAFDVLKQLREKIKGLDPALATNLISQMGIDPSLIHLLQMTNSEFARLSKTVAGMSSEQEGSFLRAKETLVQFGLVMKYFSFDIVGRLIMDLQALYDVMVKFKDILQIVGISMASSALVFYPWIAAIGALILILDDLAVYFRGGDSLIGLAIEGIKKIGEAMKSAFPATLSSSLSALSAVAGLMVNPIPASSALAGGIAHTINQNVTMNIHSTAPAHDVGKAAADHLDRAASQAALQTNQQGY